jgi:hypothetical protein
MVMSRHVGCLCYSAFMLDCCLTDVMLFYFAVRDLTRFPRTTAHRTTHLAVMSCPSAVIDLAVDHSSNVPIETMYHRQT